MLVLLVANMVYILAVAAVFVFATGNAINLDYQVESINERSELGEGPYWDEGHQRLYWVDMRNMWINSYSPDTGDLVKATIDTDKKPVTLVIRVMGTEDKFVIALKGSLALAKWDGKSNATIKPMEFLNLENPKGRSRCNDGKVDHFGRLWVGSLGAQTVSDPKGNQFEKNKGNVYKVDFDGTKQKMIRYMQIPNGLEWSLDGRTFYLIDSLTFLVYKFDYSIADGRIANVKVVYDLQAHGIVGTSDKPNSLPDGMTIDSEGMLWVAVYGTGKVIRIDPVSGSKIFEIQLDKVLQPTSVCFGGQNLTTLYVTSAHVDWTPEFELEYPLSGYTFKITGLGVQGAGPSRPAKLPYALVEKCC